MKKKIAELWSLAWRLGLIIVFLIVVFLTNSYGVKFGFHFDFQSIPAKKEILPPGLRTGVIIEYPAVRHRDQPSQSIYIYSNQGIHSTKTNHRADQGIVLGG